MAEPNKQLWGTPAFKALLDKKGNITADGCKIIVENQRQINTRLYEGLRALFYAHPQFDRESGPLAGAYADIRKVPGDGPPGCSSGSGSGGSSGGG
jgi:hypothetical protein